MEYRTIEWDREKLYDAVWEKSAVQLAKEYGVSDVALAKICKKLKVPKPGLGYWRRKERGFKVAKVPLPSMKDPPRLVSRIPSHPKEAPEERLSPELRALAEAERSPDQQISVAADLTALHPLAVKSLQALTHGKPDEWGHVRPRAKICLDIVVTQPLIERAVRIMDAVIRGLIARGHRVLIESEGKVTTVALVDEEKLAFGTVEVVKRKKKEISPAEQRERQRNPYRYYPTEYVYTATGLLSFHIKDDAVWDVRKSWSDGKRQKIENRLNDIVFGFAVAAEGKCERRRALERQEQERREWERIRYQKAQEIRKEEERLKELHQEVDNWHRSERIRAYVEAVRLDAQSPGSESSSDLSAWIEWALSHADRLDPLKPNPPSILDEKVKYGVY